MSNLHRNIGPADQHIVYAWTYTNVAARDAATYAGTDVGKVARTGAAEPYAYSILAGVGPLSWVGVGGGGAAWTVATETTGSRSAASGEFILVDAATCVVTLPAPAADARVAAKAIAVPATATSIEIRTSGAGVTIDGTDYSSIGLALASQYEMVNVISDGTNWFIY